MIKKFDNENLENFYRDHYQKPVKKFGSKYVISIEAAFWIFFCCIGSHVNEKIVKIF